jgi:hypothetical protein
LAIPPASAPTARPAREAFAGLLSAVMAVEVATMAVAVVT